jgi:GWxTD domain-containing protein
MKFFTPFIIIGWLLFGSVLSAQILSPLNNLRQDQFGHEMFLHQVYNFPDSSDLTKSRADFYFIFVNDILTFFKKDDSTFAAGYDLSLIIYSNKNEALLEKSVSDRITVNTFEETNSRIKPIRQKISISLPPGEYHYLIQLTDSESRKTLRREDILRLASFSPDHLRLSDIIFINKIDSTNTKSGFVPNLQKTFSNTKSAFAAYCEIIPKQGTQELTTKYQIYTSLGQLVYQEEKNYQTNRIPVPLFISFKDHIIRPGEYHLNVQAGISSESVKKEQKFNVHWGTLSLQENNIDVAIEQLRLIASHQDIERLLNCQDSNERKILYDEFWKQRDPTPATSENEIKDEFFRRIDLANRNFTELYTSREGWRTDRGQVYIKNGTPDEVERQPVEMNQPTSEIWYYAKINRRYIFSDRHGTGEYHLVRVE